MEVGEDAEANIQNELDILKEANKSEHVVQYFGCFMKEATLMVSLQNLFWQTINIRKDRNGVL